MREEGLVGRWEDGAVCESAVGMGKRGRGETLVSMSVLLELALVLAVLIVHFGYWY